MEAPRDAANAPSVPPSSSASASPSDSASAIPAPAALSGLPADWAALEVRSDGGYVATGRGESIKVEEGSVFEVARVALPEGVKKLVVPKGAKVKGDAPAGALFVVTEKSLRFKGHPAAAMPLEGLRANMGCATKVEGDGLVIGTFGEWTSKEGGVDMVVAIRAPKELLVSRRADLEGFESVSNKGEGKPLGAWFGKSAPTVGWERVTLEMDPRHIASKL